MFWIDEAEDAIAEADGAAVFVIALPRVRNTQIRLGLQGMQSLEDLLVSRVKNTLRQNGYGRVYARFSGLELIVIVPGILRLGEISLLGETLRQVCAEPIKICGETLNVDPIVGISISPDDGVELGDLIARAQIAADNATQSHARTPVFFAGPMAKAADLASRIEMELRKAIDDQAFNIVFQPQFQFKDRRFSAAEVLVRWHHPVYGIIPPSDFIPIAESAGLVNRLGSFVLHEAVLQMNEFRKQVAPIDLAVNVSPSQLVQEDFVDEVKDLLRSVAMPPQALTIEITEGELLFDIEMAIHQLGSLRKMGVRSSIDDFGAGFSNLAYLHRLPIDQLKIDRRFVQQLGTDQRAITLLRSTIDLGHGLGLEVCVEGVEHPRQLELLERLGCDLVQGYLFAKPLPMESLRGLIGKAGTAPALSSILVS